MGYKLKRPRVVIFTLDTHWVARGTTSQTSDSNPSEFHVRLEHGIHMCYFGPHDGGQHPEPIHTFHPCRLPPGGSQTI